MAGPDAMSVAVLLLSILLVGAEAKIKVRKVTKKVKETL